MRNILLLFSFFFCTQTAFTQNFKVVGYLPYYRFSWLNDIEFQRLTHVNISFANPVDSSGNLSVGGVSITNAVQKAHQSGCKVFICIGGGYLTPGQEASWDYLALEANRPAFIEKIVAYVQSHQLDGVDIDLEWQYVKDWYSPFIIDLNAALEPLGYELTAAFPGNYRYPKVNNTALQQFDWVNMMIYDLTGPWDPTQPGQHSPYWWAEDCVNYWLGQNMPPSKLTLGVPFYGYDFGQSPVTAYTYRYIVNQDTLNAQADQTAQIYYNGIPTIKAKTQLAQEKVSGVMIWELGGDVYGVNKDYSLLKAIDEAITPVSNVVDEPIVRNQLRLYPNPANDWISLGISGDKVTLVCIFDAQGRRVFEKNVAAEEIPSISTRQLLPGMYSVTVLTADGVVNGHFVKM